MEVGGVFGRGDNHQVAHREGVLRAGGIARRRTVAARAGGIARRRTVAARAGGHARRRTVAARAGGHARRLSVAGGAGSARGQVLLQEDEPLRQAPHTSHVPVAELHKFPASVGVVELQAGDRLVPSRVGTLGRGEVADDGFGAVVWQLVLDGYA